MALVDINGNPIDGVSSPIHNKRVHFIGDSNLQYISDELKTYLEDTYGCIVTSSAKAGATWETTNGSDTDDISSAVGQVNQAITGSNVDEYGLLTAYDIVVIMMGTNMGTLGTLSDTSSDVTTMCGAMRYCMEKLCYYARRKKIGVIIPIRDNFVSYVPSDTLEQLQDEMACIKEIARQYSVPTLNLWDEGRIIPNSFTPDGSTHYLSDDVHMGNNGKIHFMDIVGKWIAYQL